MKGGIFLFLLLNIIYNTGLLLRRFALKINACHFWKAELIWTRRAGGAFAMKYLE
jgi:hypothetical protein